MEATQGSLVLIDLNTPSPSLYWKGAKLTGVASVRVDWDDNDDHRVKLKMQGADASLVADLRSNGILVKEV